MKYLLAQIKKSSLIPTVSWIINGIFILFLVIFGSYQNNMQAIFMCSTTESSVMSCSFSYGKPYLNIFCAFLSSQGSCDKQNLTFVVI